MLYYSVADAATRSVSALHFAEMKESGRKMLCFCFRFFAFERNILFYHLSRHFFANMHIFVYNN